MSTGLAQSPPSDIFMLLLLHPQISSNGNWNQTTYPGALMQATLWYLQAEDGFRTELWCLCMNSTLERCFWKGAFFLFCFHLQPVFQSGTVYKTELRFQSIWSVPKKWPHNYISVLAFKLLYSTCWFWLNLVKKVTVLRQLSKSTYARYGGHAASSIAALQL